MAVPPKIIRRLSKRSSSLALLGDQNLNVSTSDASESTAQEILAAIGELPSKKIKSDSSLRNYDILPPCHYLDKLSAESLAFCGKDPSQPLLLVFDAFCNFTMQRCIVKLEESTIKNSYFCASIMRRPRRP